MSVRIKTITIEAGDLMFTVSPPESFGDNPTYFANQVDEQLDVMKVKARKVFEAYYGTQQ